jgi:hypothetical protein
MLSNFYAVYAHLRIYIVKENLIINLELKIQILFERRKFLFINILNSHTYILQDSL